MRELLTEAVRENRAVGSFTTPNLEIALGTILAAEESRSPVIIQIAEGRLKHSPLNFIGPMMVRSAKDAAVPVCVHLDHGLTLARVSEALSYGFTSIMFDGSRFSLEDNIRYTNEAARLARGFGASVEAELGTIGGREATDRTEKASCTDVGQAREFAARTDMDALAPAIGNVHGHYAGVPHLDLERLAELRAAIPQPLVLHGGSGISDADFRRCIEAGARKINIATASLDAMTDAARSYFREDTEHTFYGLNERMTEAVYHSVKHFIRVFNNKEEL